MSLQSENRESWEKEDDLRFELLVEKEALRELSIEESDELERLTKKRDRIVARVTEEDLLRERMRSSELRIYWKSLHDPPTRNPPMTAPDC
jgi:hypothetical protein